MKPDPKCSNCEGRGWVRSQGLDIHGEGRHDCFCVIEEPPDLDALEEAGQMPLFEGEDFNGREGDQ